MNLKQTMLRQDTSSGLMGSFSRITIKANDKQDKVPAIKAIII